MAVCDVRVVSTSITFAHVPFAKPLRLSSGPVDGLTEARVRMRVRTRDGREAAGEGSVLLSYPWAGGTDGAMRAHVAALADAARSLGFGDPFEHGAKLLDLAGTLVGPALAAAVALGPVDQAVHDAWARAAGASAYAMYAADHLNHDLSHYLGPDFAGRWPGEWLAARPATVLPVQDVLGVDEPVENTAGRRWVKVKLSGDVAADIVRVRKLERYGGNLSLDPNEAYLRPAELAELLAAVRAEYVEQPVPRDQAGPGPLPVPVLADEGLPDPRALDELTGWDGIVVKTCRGQTAALLAYCWARLRGRLVVQQDLSHVGPALAHAATFAAHCHYSWPAFECNSLRYAPAGNVDLERERPGLVHEQDGCVAVSSSGIGIR